ncbi:MAG: hypothetical protein SCALA701_08650 [Candidatus Scalindua sp.]|nr:MAG: hypothetical protein SCALA701_08650 [Candidatus Scalindua sp.]
MIPDSNMNMRIENTHSLLSKSSKHNDMAASAIVISDAKNKLILRKLAANIPNTKDRVTPTRGRFFILVSRFQFM